MCRMIALYARGGGGSLASRLIEALPRVARSDPLRGNESHCDGVGYIALWRLTKGWEIDYHRYDAGSGACEENLEHLETMAAIMAERLQASEEALLILHARKAPPGSPRGPHNTHPFNAKTIAGGKPLEIYLAHNGGLDISLLARQASLTVNPEKWVDSNLYTLYLANRISMGERLHDILDSSRGFVETALDTALLLIHGDKASLYFYSYINLSLEDKKKEYYSYYILKAPSLRAAIPSSMVKRALPFPASLERLTDLQLLGNTLISS